MSSGKAALRNMAVDLTTVKNAVTRFVGRLDMLSTTPPF